MKYKEGKEKHPLFDDVVNLWILNCEFYQALKYLNEDKLPVFYYKDRLCKFGQSLKKLITNIDLEHKLPTIAININPNASIKDLVSFEEHYYNKVKDIGNKALELKDFEVLSYMTYIIYKFEHYFCTINEDNNSGETSS